MTSWASDARYSGSMVRKVVECLPAGQVFWAPLHGPEWQEKVPWLQYAPPSIPLSWRLRGGTIGYFWTEMQAQWRARKIVEHLGGFQPTVVWVAAELGAINVGRHLARMLALPIHGTFLDAQECARFRMPAAAYWHYERSVRRLIREVASFDAISEELRRHVLAVRGERAVPDSLVFPPAVPLKWCSAPTLPALDSGVKRIGMCGSMRSDPIQWERFLSLLKTLPDRFEILAFVDRDSFHETMLPPNVVVRLQPFVSSEAGLIDALGKAGVHVCYLGLWRDPQKGLFASTSLSSKLITYCAAGLPTIVDGPGDSVAWRFVRDHGAGVLLEGDAAGATASELNRSALRRILNDAGEWQKMSEGAARLVAREFDLDRNVERLTRLMERYAGEGTGKTER